MNAITRRTIALVAAATVSLGLLAGCAGSTSGSDTGPKDASASSGGAGAPAPVLPVDANPITNTSTVDALTIESVLVENNVDVSGKATDDHLEIALTNDSAAELTGFEVYYTFSDPKSGDTEGYYAKLPSGFTIASGATRVAHFDNASAEDHFAVNEFSMYASDTNALDVAVVVSAAGVSVQTASVTKDAGGAETAD